MCRKVELILHRVQQAAEMEHRRNSRKGKGPALAEDRGEILKLNSLCKNKITMWSRLKYSSDDLCL